MDSKQEKNDPGEFFAELLEWFWL